MTTCEYLKRLDEYWNHDKDSSLHHDNRCVYCDRGESK